MTDAPDAHSIRALGWFQKHGKVVKPWVVEDLADWFRTMPTEMDTSPTRGMDLAVTTMHPVAIEFATWLRDVRYARNHRKWAEHCNEAFAAGATLELAQRLYDGEGLLQEPWDFGKLLIKMWRIERREAASAAQWAKREKVCRECGNSPPGIWDGDLCPACQNPDDAP